MHHSHVGMELGFRVSKHSHQCLYNRKFITFLPTKPKIHSHQTMQNCVKIYRYYNIRVNLQLHYSCCISFFYSFFTYAKDEGRKWMVVVICEERETKKKKKKNNQEKLIF